MILQLWRGRAQVAARFNVQFMVLYQSMTRMYEEIWIESLGPGPPRDTAGSSGHSWVVGKFHFTILVLSFFYGHTYLHKGSTYLGPNRIQI